MSEEKTSSPVLLRAPLDGVALPLANVRDEVFASGTMGPGLAIEPTSSVLVAPCAGVVSHVAKTGHALSLRVANQAEVLMHIGIDTVSLHGKGFSTMVAQGDTVVPGQPLIEFDTDAVARGAPSLQCVVVVTTADVPVNVFAPGRVLAGQSEMLEVGGAAATHSPAGVAGSAALTAEARVGHAGGLHARPAALVHAAVRDFAADVSVVWQGRQASVRSITAIMGLGVNQFDVVTVRASGRQAEAALAAATDALQKATGTEHSAPAAPPAQLVASEPQLPETDGASGWRGVGAAPGIALGQAARLDVAQVDVPQGAEGVDIEIDRLLRSVQTVRQQVLQSIERARLDGAEDAVGIFTAHQALLEDPELMGAAERHVLNGAGAGWAVRCAVVAQCQVLLESGNPLLAERVADLRDIEQQWLTAMGYVATTTTELKDRSVVVADDLTPSQLTQLPREKMVALVTARGGGSSHVAILARAMGLPLVVAVGARVMGVKSGQAMLVDADGGVVQVDPTPAQVAQAQERIARAAHTRTQALRDATLAAKTLDGVHIEVAANIANVADAQAALAQGADGVGLLRTEFLFETRTDMPGVDEQRDACQAVLDAMAPRPVIIRTLDAGGDKEVAYLQLPHEDNPALGLRGIRTGFAQPDVLDAQLRALLGLKPLTQLRVLVPMVSEVAEIVRVRHRMEALARELGVAALPQLGVMIEVPSAALLAGQLAAHVDFFSIGTNDLTQYTLAMDRCHPALAERLDPLHPAVLRLIDMTVRGAAQHGKWVGMCGAMASDLVAVPVLLGLGVTELSVSPVLVSEVKARVRALSAQQCRAAVAPWLELNSAAAVRQAAVEFAKNLVSQET